MRVSDPMSAVQQYPPGWYPDPATPGRDRWWDGTASTRFTAKTIDPAKAMFGLPYIHSMRIGANQILIAARVLVIAVFLVMIFLLAAIGAVVNGTGSIVEYRVVTAAGLVGCFATIVIGIIGLRRAPALGAKGVAIWAIACGSAAALFMLLPVFFAIFYRP
jgi:hypothetical protein